MTSRDCGLIEVMGIEIKLGLALSSDLASCSLKYMYISLLNNCDELLDCSTQSRDNTWFCGRISTNNSAFNLRFFLLFSH